MALKRTRHKGRQAGLGTGMSIGMGMGLKLQSAEEGLQPLKTEVQRKTGFGWGLGLQGWGGKVQAQGCAIDNSLRLIQMLLLMMMMMLMLMMMMMTKMMMHEQKGVCSHRWW